LFPTPVLFKKIQSASGTSWEEMYKVFNMGHRLEVYTSEEAAKALISIAADCGVDAKIIGRCEACSHGSVTVSGEHGTFKYSN
jgi:phosphoribosylformylglycinamidine cyclo-ligase